MSAANHQQSPTVSVIICAYNAASFISGTIESVLAQTYRSYEIIVVNDGSTDATESMLKPYQHEIKYFRQANAGPASARNTGLRQARGKFIAILDSDDQWLPEYLETMMARMGAEPEVDVLYPNAILFDAPEWEGKLFQDVYPSSLPVTLDKVLARECSIFISALFKREVLDMVGYYDESLCGSEDFDLWLRMLQHGCYVTFTSEVLVRYRKRSNSLSSGSIRYYQNVQAAYTKVLDFADITTRQRALINHELQKIEAELQLVLAKENLAEGDFTNATKHFAEVLGLRPSFKLKMVLVFLVLFPEILFWFVTKQTANVSITPAKAQLPPRAVLIKPESPPLP